MPLIDQAPSVFEGRHTKAENVDVDELYKKIGKLEMVVILGPMN